MTSTLQGNLPEVETEINKPRTKPFAALPSTGLHIIIPCHVYKTNLKLPIQSFPMLELLALQSCSVTFVHPWIYPRQLEHVHGTNLNPMSLSAYKAMPKPAGMHSRCYHLELGILSSFHLSRC
ncbi:hypothetical protein N7465_008359 [Penicillium sp. CMV-2018d]|nr:hypothetical protein N7465_008359 [Penicillium sp. CMV-2018d]